MGCALGRVPYRLAHQPEHLVLSVSHPVCPSACPSVRHPCSPPSLLEKMNCPGHTHLTSGFPALHPTPCARGVAGNFFITEVQLT